MAARTDATPVQSRARLALASAKALLRGVLPFSAIVAPGAMPSSEFGVERPRPEGTREAAQEALELLQGTTDLKGEESTESTITKARALVLTGELDDAIATLERFLDTGLALGPPTSNHTVTPQPGSDLAVRTQKTILARLVLARARVAEGDRTAAQVVLHAASDQLAALAPGRPAAHLFRELGELYELVQDPESAAAAYRQALQAAGLSASQITSSPPGARTPSLHGPHDDPSR